MNSRIGTLNQIRAIWVCEDSLKTHCTHVTEMVSLTHFNTFTSGISLKNAKKLCFQKRSIPYLFATVNAK